MFKTTIFNWFLVSKRSSRRFFSDSIKGISLRFKSCGDPLKVVELTEEVFTKKLQKGEILLKCLSAAIHPSDINTIQGQYPIKPALPAIVGNEGFGEVLEIGKDCNVKVGDFVIPKEMNSGTWTSHKIVKESEIIKVSKKLKPELGAIFCVNPGTAYRMLNDFTSLKPGDVIIQNAATSAVGIYIIQMAKLRKLVSINIIRSRNTEEATKNVKDVLTNEYGADFVFTEEELKEKLSKTLGLTGMAKLALNCVGGKASLPLLKSLKQSGALVTYGAMNRMPMQIPVSPLIFSDISIRGFWMSRWSNLKIYSKERLEMIDVLADMFYSELLKPSPYQTFDFKSQWNEAISKSLFKDETPEGLGKKGILVMKE